jgi:hypothetical protein
LLSAWLYCLTIYAWPVSAGDQAINGRLTTIKSINMFPQVRADLALFCSLPASIRQYIDLSATAMLDPYAPPQARATKQEHGASAGQQHTAKEDWRDVQGVQAVG